MKRISFVGFLMVAGAIFLFGKVKTDYDRHADFSKSYAPRSNCP